MIIVISSAIVAVLLTSRLSDDVCCTSDDSSFCSISTFYNTSIVTLVSVVTSSDTSCSGGTVSTGVCPGAGFSGCTTSPCTWVGQFHRLLHLLNRLRKECAVSLVESCCGRFGLRWLREFGPGRCRALSLSALSTASLWVLSRSILSLSTFSRSILSLSSLSPQPPPTLSQPDPSPSPPSPCQPPRFARLSLSDSRDCETCELESLDAEETLRSRSTCVMNEETREAELETVRSRSYSRVMRSEYMDC
jgi:hypothetical protein